MLRFPMVVAVMSLIASGLGAGTGQAPPGRASAATTAPATRSGGGGSVTLAFTGDTLVHLPLALKARTSQGGYDFKPMFAPVKRILEEADLAICHLEVPLSPDDADLSGYPRFSAPHELADALAYAGFDGCSTASNHSYDRGEAGVYDTIDILAAAGLQQAGMAASPGEAWDAEVYRVGDLTVAHISAAYWLNGLSTAPDRQWLIQILVKDEILAIAARARRAGADLVVVSAHCCIEYLIEPTAAQRALYEDLIRSPDIDLVVGHHSHVVGPIDRVDGKFIIYGLGNFFSVQRQTATLADGVIAMVTASEESGRWRVVDVDVVPTWVMPGTSRIVPAMMVEPPSYRRTLDTVNLYGGFEIGSYIWSGHPGARLPAS